MHSRIAIVGVSALFPGSPDAGSFWSNILAGKDLITDVPPTHWLIEDYYDADPSATDKTYCKRGAFLPPVAFNSLEFGIPPSMLSSTDTSQLLALIMARQVLEDASVGQFSKVERERISVILGVASGTELLGHMVSRLQRPSWQRGLRETGMAEELVQQACDRIADQFVGWQESTFPGLLGNVVAGRIANRLDLGGTNCVVDAACASSLSAVSMAINELALGQSDLAIVGGVDTINDILMYMCFSKTPALSATGDCRPFSAKADGTMMGEGLAMLALRRLEDAERDGDAIYAVIAGIGSSSDGRSKSVYAPVAAGQAKALRRTYAEAGYGPETVELVEAHGTGTIAGDAAEFKGLLEVFDQGDGRKPWCALGSVKSQIGHTKAAAGAAGLFKAVMALHHRVLPPTIKIEQPNPEMNLPSSPFYLNTEARPWIANPKHPRRASVSAFGFGGSNFHVALEEYVGAAPGPKRLRASTAELVVLAAETAGGVSDLCLSYLAKTQGGVPMAIAARDSRAAFDAALPARLAVVGSDENALRANLEKAASRLATEAGSFEDPAGIYFQHGEALGGIGFLFPGQGSQRVGMGAHLANEFEMVRQVWDQVAAMECATDQEETRLIDVVYPHPVFSKEEREQQEQHLTQTQWAQPALGVASLGYLDVLSALGVVPTAVAGHSFGELTALCAAGVLDRKDFLEAAFERGRVMAAAAKVPGAMTAITGSVAEVESWIAKSGANVVVANANGPRQTVASGSVTEIETLETRLEAEGASFRRLKVGTAFHSPLVADSSDVFLEFLKGMAFRAGKHPVFSNSEVTPYPTEDSGRCRTLLASQISRPVRFVEQIEAMYESGVRIFIEAGPGATLTNLTQQCLAGKPHQAVALDRKGVDGVVGLLQGLGRLAAAGVELQFDALLDDVRLPAAPAAAKAGVSFPISGVNYGKPYPGTGPGASPLKPLPPVTAHPTTAPANSVDPQGAAVPTQRAEPGPGTPAAALRQAGAFAPVATYPRASTQHLQTSNTKRQGHSMNNDSNGSNSSQEISSWLPVYLEIQRQTAEAHLVYQRSMTEGHTAYLRTMEIFFSGLTGASPAAPWPLRLDGPSLQGQPVAPAVPQAMAAQPVTYAPPRAVYQAPAPAAPVFAAPQVAAPAPMRTAPQAPASARQSVPSAPVMQAAPAPRVAAAPVVAATAAISLKDLKSRLLEVVAEKTGYPVEILDLNMDMEADLGIDSIKRVEILSAFRETTPNMPEIKAKEMAGLRTLAEVVTYVEGEAQPVARGSL